MITDNYYAVQLFKHVQRYGSKIELKKPVNNIKTICTVIFKEEPVDIKNGESMWFKKAMDKIKAEKEFVVIRQKGKTIGVMLFRDKHKKEDCLQYLNSWHILYLKVKLETR